MSVSNHNSVGYQFVVTCSTGILSIVMPLQLCSDLKMEGREKSRVVRNLFGTPNHEELRKDLDKQLKEISSMTSLHMKNTWNFDSDLDVGLDGRYEWSLIQADEYVPAIYRKQYRPTKFRSFKKRVDRCTDVETPPSSPIPTPTPVEVLTRLQGSITSNEEDRIAEEIENMRRENETTPETRIVPVKQTRIGDFMRVKKPCKRRLEEDLEESPSSRSSKSQKFTH